MNAERFWWRRKVVIAGWDRERMPWPSESRGVKPQAPAGGTADGAAAQRPSQHSVLFNAT